MVLTLISPPRLRCRRCTGPVVKPECEPGAEPDRLGGLIEKTGRYFGVAYDREAPVVEGDQLGQRLSAQAPAIAGDEVDPEPDGGRSGPGRHRLRPGGTGRTLAVPQHQPMACCLSSASKTRRELRIRRTTPVG